MVLILVIRCEFSKECIKLLIECWFIFSTSLNFVCGGIDIELDSKIQSIIKWSLIGVMMPEVCEPHIVLDRILSIKVFASSLRRVGLVILGRKLYDIMFS